MREAVQGSLERLEVDCIDLFYQHRVDRTVPIEETWSELKVLVSSSHHLCVRDGSCISDALLTDT